MTAVAEVFTRFRVPLGACAGVGTADICIAQLVESIDVTVVNVALPEMKSAGFLYHALPPAPWYQHIGHARSPFSAGGGVSASSRAAIAALPRSIVARMSGLRWNAALS